MMRVNQSFYPVDDSIVRMGTLLNGWIMVPEISGDQIAVYHREAPFIPPVLRLTPRL